MCCPSPDRVQIYTEIEKRVPRHTNTAGEGGEGEPLAQLGRNPGGFAALLSAEWAVKTFLDSVDIPASGHPNGSRASVLASGQGSWPTERRAGSCWEKRRRGERRREGT